MVGVGQNAHGALILAAGGGCDAVAIVDGLWGPWPTADEAVDAMYGGIRRMLDDEGATSPPPASGLDPRTRHGYGVTVSAAFVAEVLGRHHLPGARRRDARRPPRRRERARRADALVRRPGARASQLDDAPTRRRWWRPSRPSGRGIASVGSLPCWAGRRWTSSRVSFFVDGARAAYRWFRDHEPVFHDEANDLWGIATYDGVRAAGRDTETFSSALGSRPEAGPMPWMIDMDGAAHSKRRRLVSGGFTPARVRATEPQVRGDLRRPHRPGVRAGRVRRRARPGRAAADDRDRRHARRRPGRSRRPAAVVPRDAGVAHRRARGLSRRPRSRSASTWRTPTG